MPSTLPRDDAGKPYVACIIDGKPLGPNALPCFPVVSSQKQEIVHYTQSASTDIAIKAVDSSWKTFQTYKKTSVYERRDLLIKAADLFDRKVKDSVNRQMTETSCDEAWAEMNIRSASAFCRDLSTALESALSGEVKPTGDGSYYLITREPIGPVLDIIPWNGAVALCARAIASALAAGCTVLLKASELCPWTHQLVAETFLEAGFPAGSVNMIISSRSDAPQITEAIISQPSLRKIEFIGSQAVAKNIGAVAAKYLKPIVMELGDQSPAIVLDDADLAQAAELIVKSAMLLHGQVCFSTERIIVHSTVKNEFYKHLVEAVRRLPSAGQAVSNAFAQKAKAAVDDAIDHGAKFLVGSSALTGPAAVAPSILTDVNPNALLFASEGFAPTASTFIVDNDQEAIEEANSRDGGLSAVIFTSSYERGLRVAQGIEFGMVQINTITPAGVSGPATSVKSSGWGSTGGRYGIENFLYYKAISLAVTKHL
ncbi:Aldehyde/histidinol dehydrogenase [Ilyonectria robusta]|uniref:Aldehyde/histidinol dehydrogenase n=1 Tax=Ilyonectria robusta TaxID=1079257 RepID=UPI001E8EB14A|nr:Aldehyde/histidinol dehydrogenase [Ilyonectria robusta]KAH8650775.1 Aldehyde/histidinol dehydrogenase [Ilyonectria robusta]